MTKPEKTRPTFGVTNPAPAPAVAPSKRLIVPKELPLLGIHYSTNHLRRLWNAGRFPKPTYTSTRRFAWPEEVLLRWIDQRIAKHTAMRGGSKVA